MILDEIEFWVSEIIYKDVYIKIYGLWVWGLACASVSQAISRSTIVGNAFSSHLETHKSQSVPMVAPWEIAKLSASLEATIFPPPVPYPFISYQCLKYDRWTTLLLRNSIVAMDFQNLQTQKIWIVLRGETYLSLNLLTSTYLLLYRCKCIKLSQAKILENFIILFS